MAKHAKLAPSSAERWMLCPGSIRLSQGVKQEISEYAEEGSAAHAIAEYCLCSKTSAASSNTLNFYRKMFPEYEQYIDAEMIDHVQVYLNTVYEHKHMRDKLIVEEKKDISWIHPDIFGTVDCAIKSSADKTLRVFDLKYGAGILVEPKNNVQQILYALGVLTGKKKRQQKIKKVELIIVQPRIPHPDGPVRKWTLTQNEILIWAKKLKKAAKATEDPHAPLNAGEKQCRFCPALGSCPEAAIEAVRSARNEFGITDDVSKILDDAELPKAELLTNGDLSKALEFIELYGVWAKAVKKEAIARIEKGQTVEGYKLVASKTHRRWNNEQEAIDSLGLFFERSEFINHTLLSPAALEKKLGANAIKDLWYKPKQTTIAKESDSRPALDISSAKEDFESFFK